MSPCGFDSRFNIYFIHFKCLCLVCNFCMFDELLPFTKKKKLRSAYVCVCVCNCTHTWFVYSHACTCMSVSWQFELDVEHVTCMQISASNWLHLLSVFPSHQGDLRAANCHAVFAPVHLEASFCLNQNAPMPTGHRGWVGELSEVGQWLGLV